MQCSTAQHSWCPIKPEGDKIFMCVWLVFLEIFPFWKISRDSLPFFSFGLANNIVGLGWMENGMKCTYVIVCTTDSLILNLLLSKAMRFRVCSLCFFLSLTLQILESLERSIDFVGCNAYVSAYALYFSAAAAATTTLRFIPNFFLLGWFHS